MNWFPPRPFRRGNDPKVTFIQRAVQGFLQRVEKLISVYPKIVILFFAVGGVLLVIGMTRIEIDTVFSEYYPPESPVRRTINLMDEQFLGTENMEILLETETEGAFRDPEMLHALESIKTWLETRYPELVTYNWTMNNQLKQTHKKLMGSVEEAYKIPESPELISQLLLLIEAGDYEDL